MYEVAIDHLNPPLEYSTYMNKITKSVVQFKKLDQNIQRNLDKNPCRKQWI